MYKYSFLFFVTKSENNFYFYTIVRLMLENVFWPIFDAFFLLSVLFFFAIFRPAAMSRAVLLFASSVVSVDRINSGLGVGSSKTGAGSVKRKNFSQSSLRDFEWKNWPVHDFHGNGGSAEFFSLKTGTPK